MIWVTSQSNAVSEPASARGRGWLHRGPHERALAPFGHAGLSDPMFLSTYTWMLLRATLLGSTLRTIDQARLANRDGRRALPQPIPLTPVRHRVERICFPGWRRFLAPKALLHPGSPAAMDGRVTGDKRDGKGSKLHSLGTPWADAG